MGWWVAHQILVSAPVPLELILTGFDWVGGLGFGTGLDNLYETITFSGRRGSRVTMREIVSA